MATCLIGLGANSGDRAANLAAAIDKLSAVPDVTVVRQSRLHASHAAAGGERQEDFLNSVVVVETPLAPRHLLAELHRIESQLGRRRQQRWAARSIDLDLLQYDDLVVADDDLILPHPRLAFRRFVLQPAAEIAPDILHPTTRFSLAELLARLDHTPRRVVITGTSRQQNAAVAARVAAQSDALLTDRPDLTERADELTRLQASPTCHTAIELVHQHRNELRSIRQGTGATGLMATNEIGSVWVGKCLAAAKLVLPAAAWLEFERTWRIEPDSDELDRTTLIAVLSGRSESRSQDVTRRHAAGDDGASRPSTPRGGSVGDGERTITMQAELERLATRPRRSPWLLLDVADVDWAVTEVTAAIEAMQ